MRADVERIVEVEIDGAAEAQRDGVAALTAAIELEVLRYRGTCTYEGYRLVVVPVVGRRLHNLVPQVLQPVEPAVGAAGRVGVEFLDGEGGAVAVAAGAGQGAGLGGGVGLHLHSDGRGVDHVVVVDVLVGQGVALRGARQSAPAHHARGIVVDAGVERHFLAVGHLGHRRAHHLQHVAVALEALLGGAAQVGAVLLLVPDAHRAVHEVGDALLVGQCLADAQLGGVGVVDHVRLGQEVGVHQSDGLAQLDALAGVGLVGFLLRRAVLVARARGERGCRGQHRGREQ